MRIKEMLPICCQDLTEFVWNPHKYWLLFGRFLIRTLLPNPYKPVFFMYRIKKHIILMLFSVSIYPL